MHLIGFRSRETYGMDYGHPPACHQMGMSVYDPRNIRNALGSLPLLAVGLTVLSLVINCSRGEVATPTPILSTPASAPADPPITISALTSSTPIPTHTPTATPVLSLSTEPPDIPTATTALTTSTPSLPATPTATPPPASAALSLDEYLSRLKCSSLDPTQALDTGTYGEKFVLASDAIDRISGLVPPEEVVEWHHASLAYFKSITAFLESFPGDETITAPTFLAHIRGSQTERRRIEKELPIDVRQRLAEAGCPGGRKAVDVVS